VIPHGGRSHPAAAGRTLAAASTSCWQHHHHHHHHLIRLLKNSRNEQGLFLYLVLERSKANLALARHSLRRIETDLAI
jgi:hypothetical protein